MKKQFSHDLFTSFYLYLDYKNIEELDAYHPRSSEVFQYIDNGEFSGLNCFYASRKQFVWNSDSLSIDSGVYVNSVFVPEGTSGCSIDRINGRVLLDSSLGTGIEVSGNYYKKEINLYFAQNDDEGSLLMENNFYSETDKIYAESVSGRLSEQDYIIPATFLVTRETENNPYALGGMQKTENIITAVTICEDNYQVDGLMSFYSDLKERSFKLLSFEDYPLARYNNLKNPNFSYSDLFANPDNSYVDIGQVKSSKIDRKINQQASINRNYKIIFTDFYLYSYRFVNKC